MDLDEYNALCHELRNIQTVIGVAMRHCKFCRYDIYERLKETDQKLEEILIAWKQRCNVTNS